MWPAHYKRITLSEQSYRKEIPRKSKVSFQPSDYMVFKYNASLRGIVVTHSYIDGVQTYRFKLSKLNKDEISLPRQKACTLRTVPIKKVKLDDIGKI
jgi:hypothetical protein